MGVKSEGSRFELHGIIDVDVYVVVCVRFCQRWRHQEQLIWIGRWMLNAAMGSFANTPACRAVGARFLGFGAVLTWLAAIAFCTCSPARFARCMSPLTWLGRFVNMSLPEVAIQYISPGK
jgi:hypothetical protein